MTSTAEKWLTVAAVPVLAFVVGAIALPRPLPVSAELEDVDRESLGAAVSRIRPQPRSPASAELGDVVKVLGADLPEKALSRGARLAERFYFGAIGDLEQDWMIFVHVDAKNASYRIHGDHFPVRGKYQTTLWQAGDFIADDWSTLVPRDAASGVYDVWIGFYIGEERLEWSGGNTAAHDGKNRVRVGSIVIE
jgi:hypothetical protein